MDFLKYTIPSLLVVAGWIVVHYLTIKRDTRNKKEEISLNHLINAYRVLNDIGNRDPKPEEWRKLENILADIQLFGTKKQIELVIEFIDKFTSEKTATVDNLINDLRNNLREQIGLMRIEGNVKFLRYVPNTKSRDRNS